MAPFVIFVLQTYVKIEVNLSICPVSLNRLHICEI